MNPCFVGWDLGLLWNVMLDNELDDVEVLLISIMVYMFFHYRIRISQLWVICFSIIVSKSLSTYLSTPL